MKVLFHYLLRTDSLFTKEVNSISLLDLLKIVSDVKFWKSWIASETFRIPWDWQLTAPDSSFSCKRHPIRRWVSVSFPPFKRAILNSENIYWSWEHQGGWETLHKISYTRSCIIIMVIRKLRKWQYFSGGQRLVSSCGAAAGAVNVYTTRAVWTAASHQIRILHNNLLTSQHSIFQSIWEFSYSTDLSYGAGLGNMQQSI